MLNNNDDVTDLWDSNLKSYCKPEQNIPVLDEWFAVSHSSRTVISGIIYGHHKIEDGRRISTSTVKDFQVSDHGSLYLVTQNSKYKLKKQLAVEKIEPCFGKETSYINKN